MYCKTLAVYFVCLSCKHFLTDSDGIQNEIKLLVIYMTSKRCIECVRLFTTVGNMSFLWLWRHCFVGLGSIKFKIGNQNKVIGHLFTDIVVFFPSQVLHEILFMKLSGIEFYAWLMLILVLFVLFSSFLSPQCQISVMHKTS